MQAVHDARLGSLSVALCGRLISLFRQICHDNLDHELVVSALGCLDVKLGHVCNHVLDMRWQRVMRHMPINMLVPPRGARCRSSGGLIG